jgi:hypothetical protein
LGFIDGTDGTGTIVGSIIDDSIVTVIGLDMLLAGSIVAGFEGSINFVSNGPISAYNTLD